MRGRPSKDSEHSVRFISRLSRSANFARQFAEATISSFPSGRPSSFLRRRNDRGKLNYAIGPRIFYTRYRHSPDDKRCIRYGSFRYYRTTKPVSSTPSLTVKFMSNCIQYGLFFIIFTSHHYSCLICR